MRILALIILLSASLIFTISISPNTFAQSSQQATLFGSLNIGHAHFEDNSHKDTFWLFDYEGFSRPPVQLIIDNTSDLLQLTNLAGKVIAVSGTIISDPDADVITLKVSKIHPPSKKSTIELDQKIYTWTDKVYITIVSPFLKHLDPKKIDYIGNGQGGNIIISSNNYSIDNIMLAETVPDSGGIFTGELILTGFMHDADGNTRTGQSGGLDTNPRTEVVSTFSHTIYHTGFLQTQNQDTLSVMFKTNDGEVVLGTAPIQWNIGEIRWLEASYPANGKGVVRVIDPDMNLDPEKVDKFFIDVWSDSDAGGINLVVTETREATGIFEGTVSFTFTDESSGSRLRIQAGDTITAEYEDNTLPHPYSVSDELDLTASSKIGFSIPSLISNGHVDHFNESKLKFVSDYRTNPYSPPVLNQLNSVTILAKFDNAPAQSLPHTQNYFQDIFYDPHGDSLAKYYNENSYGKLSITGNVVDWVDLPRHRSHYVNSNHELEGHEDLIQDAVRLADPFIDFDGPDDRIQNISENDFWQTASTGDDVDQLIIITNVISSGETNDPKLTAFGYVTPHRIETDEGRIYVTASFYTDGGNDDFPVGSVYQKGYGVVAHEIGHNFAWYHTPMLIPHDTYSDPWSVMSSWNDKTATAGPIAYHKNKANWIDRSDVIIVSPGERKVIDLNFLDEGSPNPNSYHMVKVPFGSEFYTIEARQDSSFDHIPDDMGLVVYHFNPNGYGFEILRQNVDLDKIAPVSIFYDDNDICVRDASGICTYDYGLLDLEVGETKRDPQNNISITLLSENTDGMRVYVENNARLDVPEPPMLLNIQDFPDIPEIRLNWNAPSYDGSASITSYEVQRSGNGRNWTTLGTTQATDYNDSNVQVGQTYHYRVMAVNSVGQSLPSNVSVIKFKEGGCLIATAAYGSPLADEVQMLREIRDNKLLQTESGTYIMQKFNEFYYTFSPTVAQWERESPEFKELVKITITPLITSLSVMNYLDVDSETKLLIYGVGLVMLNIGMYFVGPAIMINRIQRFLKN